MTDDEYELAVRRAPTSRMTREQYLRAAEERGRQVLGGRTGRWFVTASADGTTTDTGPRQGSLGSGGEGG